MKSQRALFMEEMGKMRGRYVNALDEIELLEGADTRAKKQSERNKQLTAEVERLSDLIKSILPFMDFPIMMSIEAIVEEIKAWVKPTPSGKRVVWVKKSQKGEGFSHNLELCRENGHVIFGGTQTCVFLDEDELDGVIRWLSDIAEVRIWEPVEEPVFHQGSSITDGDYIVGCDFAQDGITMVTVKRDGDKMTVIDNHHVKKPVEEPDEWVCHCTTESGISDLMYENLTPHSLSTPPYFGVRRLTEDEVRQNEFCCPGWFSAFYKGERIKGSGAAVPNVCIKHVLGQFKPAVTLADLETTATKEG